MANSGVFYTSGYADDGSGAPYRFKFSWSLTGQSIDGNYSTISWSVTCDGGRTSNYYIYIYEKYVTVNGSSQSKNYEEKIFNGTVVFSGNSTIYHSADGSGSFAANCGGSFFYSGSYNSSGSGSWSLPTIPRSCGIDKIANTSGDQISSINTGENIRIYFTPKTTSFSYRTTVSIGNNSSTNTISVSNTNQVYQQFNIPHGWISSGTSGTLTCKLETINGSTVIGTSTKTITVKVDSSIRPSTSGITATYVSAGNSVVDSWGIYVQNKSKVKITLNGVSPGVGSSIKSCTATMYSTGASAQMFVSGSTASYTTGVLTSSGTLTYVAYATDNRGRNSVTRNVNIVCYPYSNVSISSLRVDRCLANGTISQDGKYAKCTFSGSCASVNGKNSVDSSVSKFYYKEKGSNTWIALHNNITSINGTAIVDGNFSISKEYEIKLIIKDLVGSSATAYGKLDTAERVFNIAKYGNGLAVGKMSTVSNRSADGKFECGWDASFDKNVSVNGKTLIDLIYPVGSIYMSANNVSPQAFFGGTWEQIQDRFLLAAGSSYSAGSIGGEATHTLTMDEMPAHQGHMYDNFDSSGYVDRGGDTNSYYVNSSASGYATYENRPYKVVSGNEFVMQGYTRGGSVAHNNMPPYLTVYMWKRTK
nr:MAG TPA: baseplate protein [Caudoviricetes sp.]